MPTVQLDENGNRVIIRHTGPPGPAGAGVPAGGFTGDVLAKVSEDDNDTAWTDLSSLTGFVEGPVSSGNDNLAIFNGTTGKRIKDSNIQLADVATLNYVQTRTPQIFTNALYDKLNGLSTAVYFRGSFANKAELVADVTDPKAGDYAITTDTAEDVYFYDASADDWRNLSDYTDDTTADAIAPDLFNIPPGEVWDQDDCYIFTSSYKAKVDNQEAVIALLSGGSGAVVTPITVVADDYTVKSSDRTVVFSIAAGSTKSCYLPSPTTLLRGQVFAIKCLVGTGVTVTRSGSELIDGVAADISVTTGECATLQTDGTNWFVLSQV